MALSVSRSVVLDELPYPLFEAERRAAFDFSSTAYGVTTVRPELSENLKNETRRRCAFTPPDTPTNPRDYVRLV